MTEAVLPITQGSTYARLELGAFRVTASSYPAGRYIPRHVHRTGALTLVFAGSFLERVGGRSWECGGFALLAKPAGEPHENRYGERGARCAFVEVTSHGESALADHTDLLREPGFLRDEALAPLIARLDRELSAPDDVTALAAEGLILELIARAHRAQRRPGGDGAPAWLSRALEYVDARFRAPLRMSEVAEAAGVHPVHLARVFRQRLGASPAEYVRARRIRWARRRLEETDDPIGRIAAAAGFSDQSHFTRVFRRSTGITPGAYRRSLRP